MNHKCLHIVYPPGLGGNHLANLISLSKQYTYNVDYNKYYQTSKNAHFAIKGQKQSISLHHFGSNNIQNYNCNNFLCIAIPETNQLAINRFNRYNNNTFLAHTKQDICLIYKQHILEKIYPGNWNTIFSDVLFDTNAKKLITQIENKLEIVIKNKYFAFKIHNAWIRNLQNEFS